MTDSDVLGSDLITAVGIVMGLAMLGVAGWEGIKWLMLPKRRDPDSEGNGW